MPMTALKEGDELIALPSGSKVLYRDSSHRYWMMIEPLEVIEAGRKVETVPLVGVTTVTGCLDKPALLPWVEAQTCAALFEPDEGGMVLAERMPADPEALAEALKRAQLGWRYTRDAAASRGTSVHAALTELAEQGTIPRPSRFPAEDQGYVRGLIRFWLDAAPEVEACEMVVASERLCMAGRFDLLWRNSEPRELCVNAETGEAATFEPGLCLTDAKTSKAVYPTENFTQLEGYEVLRLESGYEPTDERLVLRLDEGGAYEVARSTATAEDFLAVRQVYEMDKRLKASRPRPKKREAVAA